MFHLLRHYTRPLMPLGWTIRRLLRHDGIEIAGFIAYTGLVALFPFVIFLLALAGFLGTEDTAQALIRTGFTLLPPEVARTLTPIVREIFTRPQPGLLTVGIVGTLWITSSGIEALRMGCRRSWEMEETRPLWLRRLTSIGFVALGAAGALLAGMFVVVAPLLLHWLGQQIALPALLFFLATALRLLLAALLLGGTIGVLYRYLPPRRIAWRHVWPGAIIAALLWIMLASLFSYYLRHVGNYTVTYGSLGGVVITLLFLHFSAIIFLLGNEYNAMRAVGRGANNGFRLHRRARVG